MFHPIRKFFWACAGTTHSILNTKECETEHSKYVGIGATILTTGLLAGVSGSYAFFMVFPSVKWATAFGCFWGLMIFNFDRYIVLSIKKKEPREGVSMRDQLANLGREFIIALPRLCLAALLAVVIAKPLELKLFEREILLEMDFLRDDKIKEYQQQQQPAAAQGGDSASHIEGLEKKNQDLRAEIKAARDLYEEKNKIAQNEADGIGVPRRAGEGKVYEGKLKDAERLLEEYEDIKKEKNRLIALNNEEIVRLQAVQNQQAQNNQQKTLMTDGLATRLEAFSRLKDKNRDVQRTNLVLMAIILILEMAPIITKFFAGYGPYDKLVEVAERKVLLDKHLELERLEGEAKRRLDSHQHTQQTLLDVQETFFEEVRSGARNIRPNSITQAEWEDVKSAIIEKAVHDLRPNGYDK